jgi:SAM-dependent methyltransferase
VTTGPQQIAEIAEELRRELARIDESTVASHDAREQEPPSVDPGAQARAMAAVRGITGDRPLLVRPGPLRGIRGAVKRLIRRSIRWYVEDIAVQTRLFADASTRTATALADQGRSLEAQLAVLSQARRDAESSFEATAAALSGLRDRIARLERAGSEVRLAAPVPRPSAAAGPPAIPPEPGNPLDLDYFAFETLMRGPRELIAARQSGYVDVFREVDDILDAGCGRGEFLEALRDAGKRARGVDLDADMVEQCTALGLEAEHGDAISYLASLEPDSLGGLFASQVVEHLPPHQLLAFLRNAARALRPNGVIALETINPGSLCALRNYFADLTHSQPLVPETLAFLCESAGFRDLQIQYTSPVPETGRLSHVPFGAVVPHQTQAAADRNVDLLNALLFAPQDYAVLGRA